MAFRVSGKAEGVPVDVLWNCFFTLAECEVKVKRGDYYLRTYEARVWRRKRGAQLLASTIDFIDAPKLEVYLGRAPACIVPTDLHV